MYYLLKNALNFDNFKNIKLDLINKVEASDRVHSHEENEVFNFLKDKELAAEELKFGARRNSETVFSSVEKKLKHINSLKHYLNTITNLRHDKKLGLHKSIKKSNTAQEIKVDASPLLKNMNKYSYENKNVVILNNCVPQAGNEGVLSNHALFKTLCKRIEKNGQLKRKTIKKFMLTRVSEVHKNEAQEYVQIKSLKVINGKLNVYLYCCKKCTTEKNCYIKNMQIYLKKKIPYKFIINTNVHFAKRNKKFQRYAKTGFLQGNYDNRKAVRNNTNGICFTEDISYLRSENLFPNGHGHIMGNNTRFEELPLIINPFKIGIPSNKNEDTDNNNQGKWSNKINELKKYMQIFQNNFEDMHKSSSSLKNVNLSILRRISTNNRHKNKKEVNRNKDSRFQFLSNNINFYETLVNKEKCKEEIQEKDNYFSGKNIIQNGDMKEIKQKIKIALITLNNIKKNNYKLKFCLEKEIIDNTIHHNELKRSMGSLFSKSALQRKSVSVGQKCKKKNVHLNRDNVEVDKMENSGDAPFQCNTKNEKRCLQTNVILHEKNDKLCKSNLCVYNNADNKKREERSNELSETNVKFTYNGITEKPSKRKSNLENKTEGKWNIFKDFMDHEFSGTPNEKLKKESCIKENNVHLSRQSCTLIRKKLNERNCIFESLKREEENVTVNSAKNVHNCKLVAQEKNNAFTKYEREKIYETGEISNSSFLNSVKSNTKGEEVKGNVKDFEKVNIKGLCKKKESTEYLIRYVNSANKIIENFGKNCMHNKKKRPEKEYTGHEDKETTLLNNKKNKDDYMSKTFNTNAFNSFYYGHKQKKTQDRVNSMNFVKKRTDSEQLILNNEKREKGDFDLKSVRNIKKIINCKIYVNKKFERINKRNQIAINIIENYLDNRHRTSLIFPKEKEKKNIYMQTNCILEKSGKEKKVKFLPDLYDHYAFLLLNFKNCKVL
ncbi:conserved Plasmodium protein, unknown function [Plasmodium ovale]|uniref:Uncharacterized protein n=2 Tax=Plasmodium ovale TaxID=36330 RepID=A0A1A8VW28_PLAOA|nr:conserved Plasmodium protein, unknown function [Plasmodium ovale curtisi]SBS89489.1 conserved Plasmodium protein, unknown function [Plasmodium ovale curtisi]SCP04243.1 conserved Plasmodium protein, unknown function [Plasmodium ovale]